MELIDRINFRDELCLLIEKHDVGIDLSISDEAIGDYMLNSFANLIDAVSCDEEVIEEAVANKQEISKTTWGREAILREVNERTGGTGLKEIN